LVLFHGPGALITALSYQPREFIHAYSYDLRTQTYLQPIFAQQTLERFRFVNEHALNSLVAEEKLNWAVHRFLKALPFSS
jgi:hypothetical protein